MTADQNSTDDQNQAYGAALQDRAERCPVKVFWAAATDPGEHDLLPLESKGLDPLLDGVGIEAAMTVDLRGGAARCVVFDAQAQLRDGRSDVKQSFGDAVAQSGPDRMILDCHDEGLPGDLCQGGGIQLGRCRNVGQADIESLGTQGVDGFQGPTGWSSHRDHHAGGSVPNEIDFSRYELIVTAEKWRPVLICDGGKLRTPHTDERHPGGGQSVTDDAISLVWICRYLDLHAEDVAQ